MSDREGRSDSVVGDVRHVVTLVFCEQVAAASKLDQLRDVQAGRIGNPAGHVTDRNDFRAVLMGGCTGSQATPPLASATAVFQVMSVASARTSSASNFV